MSLRNKIFSLLGTVVLLYAVIDHSVQRLTVSRSFEQLEAVEANKDVERVVHAIEKEIAQLDERCNRWATWDSTARFARGENSAWESEALGPGALRRLRLNLVFAVEPGGRVLSGQVGSWSDEEPLVHPLQLRDFPGESLSPLHPLLPKEIESSSGHTPEAHHFTGILLTEHGPMMVSSRPIRPSEGGPSPGQLVLGRFLAEDVRQRITEQTHVEFDVWPIEQGALPERERDVLDDVTARVAPVLVRESSDLLHAYTTIADIRRGPGLLVRADIPRVIAARGASSVRYALISTVAAGLLLLLVLLHALQRTVLRPIASLTRHAVTIGKSEDFSAKLNLARGDEIGVLSREFDNMMEKLEDAQAALVTTARSAGMSEIATGILHNVGNVLNSVNVSATMIGQKARESAFSDLERLNAVLEDHSDDLAGFVADDPKGKHLQPYLSALTEQLGRERGQVLKEIDSLNQGVEHIRQLINSQQSYAGKADLRESTSLPDIVEKAIAISDQAAPVDDQLEIVRRIDELPRIPTDKHKLLEILVNLIQNARQAMHEAQVSDRRLVVEIRCLDEERAAISISDNGVGILAENLTKIFNHGFTTKSTGHGFGLHAAANAATEMGGSLTASSEGPGRGATFVLELPTQAATAVGAHA